MRILVAALLSILLPGPPQLPVARAEDEPRRGEHIVIEDRHRGELPTLGPRAAPVTIEFFCNLGDGSRSENLHHLLQKLAERHPRRLRLIYRLTNSSEHPSPSLELGLEAFAQGRFFPFLEAYYGPRRRNRRPENFPEIAQKARVDLSRLQSSRLDSAHERTLARNYYYAKRRRLSRTPGLLINGIPRTKRISSIGELEHLYDDAYARAQNVLASGIELQNLYPYLLATIDAQRVPPTLVGGPVDSLEPGDDPPAGPRRVAMKDLLVSEFVQGPEDAQVTAVFLCHFQSAHCGRMASRLQEARRAYEEELRLIFLPLFDEERAGQEQAGLLHRAALCARERGAFWGYYEELYQNVRTRNVDEEYALEKAKRIDLDPAELEACLSAPRHAETTLQQLKAGRRAQITHTPALVVGGMLYSGLLHFEDIRSILDAELAPGVLAQWASPTGR